MKRDIGRANENLGIGKGIYTIPDVAQILKWPKSAVRRWVSGYWKIENGQRIPRLSPIIDEGVWSVGESIALNFFALIEINTFMVLKNKFKISLQKIRRAHLDLGRRLKTPFPFAYHDILCDGRKILVELEKEKVSNSALMFLGESGQLALKDIIEPFCRRIDFDEKTQLAERLWPLGKNRNVVVDPHHCFGRPTIKDTNIPTQVIASLARAGEKQEDISQIYEIKLQSVRDAIEFELRDAA
jgi:uncharacterized protein (DUF433 family)